jgi:hypothetical protein
MQSFERGEQIASPAAWRGEELRRRDDWIYRLSPAETAEVERLARTAAASGSRREEIDRDDFDLGALAPAVAAWKRELARGRGFVLVRGLPLERLTRDEAVLVYWTLGLHLGAPVPQNLAGELLTDVTDTGADPDDPSTRLYRTRAEQDFHTDGADVIGLLCLRGAKSGGESRIVSSITVYNEIARRRPDLARVLFDDFYWHYFEPGMPEPVHFVRPICAERPGGLNTSFIAWYIRRAQELPGVPPMTDAQREAVALVERTANDPALHLDMEFRPGDVQLLKNSVILHKRTAYEDFAEPERKRHLVRLWLAAPEFLDGDEQLRRGIALG